MASIKALLGLFPRTSDIEAKRTALIKEFEELNEYSSSEELKEYLELDKLVHSHDFIRSKKDIAAQKFKNTEEYRNEQEYLRLKKDKEIKNYLNSHSSGELSPKLKKYFELEGYMLTEDFKKVKYYMSLSGKKKLEQSKEYKQESRYNDLIRSEKIKWYLKVKGSTKFNELKKWKVTFEDDFTAKTLNRDKWITRYFWGDTLLNDSYSLSHEKQYYTDGKNLELSNSILRIITKRENAKGKAWNPKLGFFPKEFGYTSGLISTGSSFRQQYGIFEAKIRFNDSYPVNQAFWMISDKILPHIEVAKAAKKMNVGSMWGSIAVAKDVKKKVARLGLIRFTKDFYIFTLEWTRNKLTWKINGLTIATATEGIPQEPMYVIFSSGLYKEINGTSLPTSMEIDWVRCYQHAESV